MLPLIVTVNTALLPAVTLPGPLIKKVGIMDTLSVATI
jgi:hypothetical protein